MNHVEITCDRCGKRVKGLEDEIGTSGFYKMSGYWGKYKQGDEQRVCDECMFGDPKFQSDYGKHTT